jgi:TPR repeat protein
MFETGDGIQQDSDKAFYWYNKAKKNGSEDALINLGILYLFGDGTEQNYKKAYELFYEALNNNNNNYDAIFNIAQMSEKGLYVEKNYITSYALYTLSQKILKKSPLQSSFLTEEDIIDSLNTLKTKMTPEEIQAGELEVANVMREYGVTL